MNDQGEPMTDEPSPYPAAPTPPPTPTSGKAKRKRWPWVVGAVVAILVIGGIASANRKSDAPPAAAAATTSDAAPSTSAPATTASSAPPTTTAAPTTPTRTTPTTPTTTAAPAYTPIESKQYTGTGDDVITIDKPVGRAALLTFSCSGCDGNVAVKSDSDLLVNEIGAYSGTHLIDVRGSEQTSTLEITADSDWTVDIADIMTAPESTSGTGDSVIWVKTGSKAAITHDGSSNFAIDAASTVTGRINLLVNEIGTYSGTVRIDAPAILDITADGNWTITPS